MMLDVFANIFTTCSNGISTLNFSWMDSIKSIALIESIKPDASSSSCSDTCFWAAFETRANTSFEIGILNILENKETALDNPDNFYFTRGCTRLADMSPSKYEDNALQIKEKSTERTAPFFVLEVTAHSAADILGIHPNSATERVVTWSTKIRAVSFESSCLIYNWLSAFS